MNVFWPEGLAKLAASGEITFKDGERLNLNVLRRMENGLSLISLKGKSFTARLDTQLPADTKTIRAEVVKSDSGTMQLRIIPKAENSTNPMRVVSQPAQTAQTAQSSQTQQGSQTSPNTQNIQPNSTQAQKLVFQIQQGTISAQTGDKVEIQILKTLDNGNTLVAVKNNLFEVKLEGQLLRNITAEVTVKSDGTIELAAVRLPVENLNPNFVKAEVAGFDITKLMRAFGKFQQLNMSEMTPENLKQAVKNSGLFMENKLMNGENMAGDEKLRAFVNSDTPAKDGITKMQITNMLLAGGLLAFLKTGDENVEDTYMRMKKSRNGQSVLYVSTKFSQLGDTFIMIRSLNKHHDVMVKTETDISEMLSEVDISGTRVFWQKFDKNDLKTMDVKDDITFNMGNFEVVI